MATKFAECWNKCQRAQDACIAGCSDDCCRYNCIDVGITCKQNCCGGLRDHAASVEGFINNASVPIEVQQLLQDMLSDMQLLNTSYTDLAATYHEVLALYFAQVGYTPPPAA